MQCVLLKACIFGLYFNKIKNAFGVSFTEDVLSTLNALDTTVTTVLCVNLDGSSTNAGLNFALSSQALGRLNSK